MDTTIIIILVGVGVLTILALIIWLVLGKSKYTHLFEVISRDGKNTRTTKGRIIKDPNNPLMKKFQFKENATLLDIREPNGHRDGKPLRRITFNMEGEYVYVSDYKVDEKNYLTTSLQPVPKALALHQMQANQRRNPTVDKTQMTAFISSIIMLVLVLIATVYISYTFSSNTKNMVVMSGDLKQVSNDILKYQEVAMETNKIFLAASNNLAGYCGDVKTAVGNLSRQLSPQSIN